MSDSDSEIDSSLSSEDDVEQISVIARKFAKAKSKNDTVAFGFEGLQAADGGGGGSHQKKAQKEKLIEKIEQKCATKESKSHQNRNCECLRTVHFRAGRK